MVGGDQRVGKVLEFRHASRLELDRPKKIEFSKVCVVERVPIKKETDREPQQQS